MYLGMALLLTAWAVYLSAWLAFAGPVAFVLYITRFQILPEERALQAHFGEAFTRYTAQVRRWL
jgi:protein-S-isoprenylcysteine O-methyltransferase Ste14